MSTRQCRQCNTTWKPRFEVHEWFFGLASEWARSLRSQASPTKATTELVRAHAGSLREDPTRAVFWLMLAYYQCRDGCLTPLVRRRALQVIHRGPDIVLWLNGSPSTPSRRRADYDRLRRLIESRPEA